MYIMFEIYIAVYMDPEHKECKRKVFFSDDTSYVLWDSWLPILFRNIFGCHDSLFHSEQNYSNWS